MNRLGFFRRWASAINIIGWLLIIGLLLIILLAGCATPSQQVIYWPILKVGIRTWGDYSYYYRPYTYTYYDNNGRRGAHEDYGPNSPACRYAGMCD